MGLLKFKFIIELAGNKIKVAVDVIPQLGQLSLISKGHRDQGKQERADRINLDEM